MAEKTETVERTTLYTWAEALGANERRQVTVMPEPFKEAAAKALKADKAARVRKSRLIQMIANLTEALTEAQETVQKTEKTLNKYADRIRTAVKAASLPVEAE